VAAGKAAACMEWRDIPLSHCVGPLPGAAA